MTEIITLIMIFNTLYGFTVKPSDEALYKTYSIPVLAYEADT